MSHRLPTLFVPHGAPTFALTPGAAGAALQQYAAGLPAPRAIIVVSPHWSTRQITLGAADRLDTIHDFWGFPEALYQIRYPATGCPAGARHVAETLQQAGLPVSIDTQRGLDHGAWVPLRLMFPDANVPVIPLSLPEGISPKAAYELGNALSPLADEQFLIIGTGSLTHNLRDFQAAWQNGGQTPAYVRQFADWLAEQLQANDLERLCDYRRQAPFAERAHPTEEHLLPLYLALGGAGPAAVSTRFHAGIDDYVIAMDAYTFTRS